MAHEYLLVAAAALIGLVVVAATLLTAWQGWLELKQRELDHGRAEVGRAPAPSSSMTRIEMADLKERIRKLEAIAAGVDL